MFENILKKFYLEIWEDRRDNNQSYDSRITILTLFLSSLNSLSDLFPSIKFHDVEETHMMLVALHRWLKLLQHLSTKDGEKMFCQVFDTDSDKKVHALHYAN